MRFLSIRTIRLFILGSWAALLCLGAGKAWGQTPPDDPVLVAATYLDGAVWLCSWSIKTGAYLYPTLWGIGVFRRIVYARLD